MNQESVRELLAAAVQAPSGHNYQPWRFRVQGDTVYVFLVPESDSTVYNFKQRGSYIALGALIENIVICAAVRKYQATVTLPPESPGGAVARIDLKWDSAIDPALGELAEPMARRATNRRRYSLDPLTPAEKEAVTLLPSSLQGHASLSYAEERTAITRIAHALGTNDQLVFNAKRVHDSLFPHIVWTPREEHEKKTGLYINTFELDPPARLLFPYFANWGLARRLGRIGFGSFVAMDNGKRYAACSAVGGIWVPDTGRDHLIMAGRLFERIWLQATRVGLSLQPLMGLLYIEQYIEEDSQAPFTVAQKKAITDACGTLRTLLPGKGRLVVTFRLGHAKPPTAYSSKKAPVIEYA